MARLKRIYRLLSIAAVLAKKHTSPTCDVEHNPGIILKFNYEYTFFECLVYLNVSFLFFFYFS